MKQVKGRLVGIMNSRNRPKVRTVEDVYDQLFEAIVDQRLLPGTKLGEMALVEAFGVSRRMVADALRRLAWERLVVVLPNRGAYVAAPHADEVREVFEARIAIECGTTEAVARAASPAVIQRLEANLAEEHALRERGMIREAIHLSGGFHILMAQLSGNGILAEQVRLLVARTSLIINLFENRSGLEGWHECHDELIDYCRESNVTKAVALMREHIRELESSIVLERRRVVTFDMLDVFGTQ